VKIVILHEKVYEFLISKGIECCLCQEKNEIVIRATIEELVVEFTMRFPLYYPYEFPQIYLFQELDFKVPHRYIDKQLCLVDTNEETAIPEQYLEIAEMLINRAIKLIKTSMSENNLLEYNKEVITYWNTKSEIYVSLIECKNDLSHYLWGYEFIDDFFIVAETIEKIKEYTYRRHKIEIDMSKVHQVLYIKAGVALLSLIKKMKDIKTWLIKPTDITIYYEYMRLKKGYKYIIFNINNLEGECIFGIRVGELFSNGIKITKKNIAGVISANSGRGFTKIEIIDLRMKRLFTRGGDGMACFDKNCLFVGAGSVGSYLLKAAIEIGITDNLTIIDNDMLTPENIGRHLCGNNYTLSDSKADAVREALMDKYPALECVAMNKNIFEYILHDEDFFRTFDIVFVAVGNTVIEKKVIELSHKKKIRQCVILWVEPYLIAGHALVLNDEINDVTYNNIFDENGNFILRVLNNGKQYLKSEAGCQSAFAPYSGFEVQKFILDFVDCYFRDIYSKKVRGNYSYTWLGKMKWARQNGLDILPRWKSKDDRYSEMKRIDREYGVSN